MNRFALFGCITLILGGLGHLFLVDVCALQFEFPFVKWLPESPLENLSRTTMDFQMFGATNAFRAFAGFSVWMALSLLFIGGQGLLIYKFVPTRNLLRLITWCINFIISIVFLSLAATCFIYPATIGGLIAAVLFALAIRKEKQHG